MKQIMLFDITWTGYEVFMTVAFFTMVIIHILRVNQLKKKKVRG